MIVLCELCELEKEQFEKGGQWAALGMLGVQVQASSCQAHVLAQSWAQPGTGILAWWLQVLRSRRSFFTDTLLA